MDRLDVIEEWLQSYPSWSNYNIDCNYTNDGIYRMSYKGVTIGYYDEQTHKTTMILHPKDFRN